MDTLITFKSTTCDSNELTFKQYINNKDEVLISIESQDELLKIWVDVKELKKFILNL